MMLSSIVVNRHRWREPSQSLASVGSEFLLLVPLMRSLGQLLNFCEFKIRLRKEIVNAP